VTVARCLLCNLSVIGDDAAVVDARFRAHDCQIVGSGAETGNGSGAASRVQPGPTPSTSIGLFLANIGRVQRLSARWWES
jgi:tetrahydrodipicolinate N-succinyltransferase